MKAPFYIRLSLNIATLMLSISALAFRITGDFLHEWIGAAVALAFIVHNVINIKWYMRIFSGKYGFVRAVNLLINIGCIILSIVMITSGLMHSRHMLAFMNLQGGMELRQIHTTSAYWLLLLISLHLGMHWESVLSRIGFNKIESKLCKNLFRVVGMFIVLCGVYFFFQRDMFSKLLLGYSFDFWDPALPSSLFYLANLSIISMYVFISQIMLKFMASFYSGKS